jgi:serine/threonine protein kinase/tetratricopeptide (TPR) repeat protein
MSQRRTCSFGHQWQSADVDGTCPVCSSSGDIFSDSASVTPGTLDELPPPPEPQQPASGQARSETSAGRYRILRPHARGGLGEVFVAEDTELGRHVALKEIQAHHADLPESRTRFVLEAQITGGLEHPGIVPVYGLGSYADGRPFYAMRFVQGESLRAAIRRFHGLPPSPGFAGAGTGVRVPRFDGVEFRQLLAQFVAVCQAVAYAHSRGVLHRDLKPDNVMLGKFGETLVVDWGLAKVIGRGEREGDPAESETTLRPRSGSHPSATAVGQALGTPTYMSPEQADGQLDELGPPADIYSLGATLYELLTGRPPFTGSVREVFLQVRRGEIVPPRCVQPAVPRPLEAVCLKAMNVRPGQRYSTAQELAADVERWLADEPVSARREPLSARVWRWIKRHRMLVTALSATVMVGLVSLAVATALLTAANERERSAHANAVKARDRTRRALDAMISGVTSDALATQKALSPEQRAFLESVLSYYQEFAAEPGEDEQERKRLADAHFQLGMIHSRLDHKEEAVKTLRQASELFAQLATDFPGVAEYRNPVPMCYQAVVLRELNRHAESEAVYRQALTLWEQLVADFPNVPDYRDSLARTHGELGTLLDDLGRRREATTALSRAMAIWAELSAADPANHGYRRYLAAGRHNLGLLFMHEGRPADAEKEFRLALPVLESLAKDFPTSERYRADLAGCYNALGELLRHERKSADAEDAIRKAVAGFEKLAVDFPLIPDYRRELAACHQNLGLLFAQMDKQAEAVREYRKELSIREQLAAEFPDVTRYRLGCAECLIRLGQPAEAAAAIDAVLPRLKEPGELYDAACFLSQASAATKDDTSAADRHAARAVAVLRQALKHGYADIAHLLKDSDLDPLRRRGDYMNLLWDLAETPLVKQRGSEG